MVPRFTRRYAASVDWSPRCSSQLSALKYSPPSAT